MLVMMMMMIMMMVTVFPPDLIGVSVAISAFLVAASSSNSVAITSIAGINAVSFTPSATAIFTAVFFFFVVVIVFVFVVILFLIIVEFVVNVLRSFFPLVVAVFVVLESVAAV